MSARKTVLEMVDGEEQYGGEGFDGVGRELYLLRLLPLLRWKLRRGCHSCLFSCARTDCGGLSSLARGRLGLDRGKVSMGLLD